MLGQLPSTSFKFGPALPKLEDQILNGDGSDEADRPAPRHVDGAEHERLERVDVEDEKMEQREADAQHGEELRLPAAQLPLVAGELLLGLRRSDRRFLALLQDYFPTRLAGTLMPFSLK